jgi:hypothetical protein
MDISCCRVWSNRLLLSPHRTAQHTPVSRDLPQGCPVPHRIVSSFLRLASYLLFSPPPPGASERENRGESPGGGLSRAACHVAARAAKAARPIRRGSWRPRRRERHGRRQRHLALISQIWSKVHPSSFFTRNPRFPVSSVLCRQGCLVVVELALLCYVFCAADSCGFKFIMCF